MVFINFYNVDMKMAIRIFLIIGICSIGVLFFMIGFFFLLFLAYAQILALFFLIAEVYLVASLIISIITLTKLDKFRTKKEVMPYGILCLIFCTIVAGILLLVISEEDLNKDDNNQNVKEENEKLKGMSFENLELKLNKLERLKSLDLIKDDEYQKLKDRIIEEYDNQ